MAYWVDDGFDVWPEVVRAGSAAAGLYVRCGAWISRGISAGMVADAIVPTEVATMYGTPEWIRRLLDVGLWRTEGDGYRDVRYFQAPNGSKLNPTADQVAANRAGNRARQQRYADKHKPKRKRVTNGSPNALADGLQTATPSLPSLREGKDGARPAPRAAAAAPENPDWRNLPAAGQPRSPTDTERAQRGADAARAAITEPRGAA